jgi:hypothetical protein
MKIDTLKFDADTQEILEAIAGGLKLNKIENRPERMFMRGGVSVEFQRIKSPIEGLREFFGDEESQRYYEIQMKNEKLAKSWEEKYPGYSYWDCEYKIEFRALIHNKLRHYDFDVLPFIAERLAEKFNEPFVAGIVRDTKITKKIRTWQEAKEWQEYYEDFDKNNRDKINQALEDIVDEYANKKGVYYKICAWHDRQEDSLVRIPFPLSYITIVYGKIRDKIRSLLLAKSKKVDNSETT